MLRRSLALAALFLVPAAPALAAPCPDASGTVRGTVTLKNATLRWEGTVGDDARLRSWGHTLTVKAKRPRATFTLTRAKLDPRRAAKVAGRGRWTGSRAKRKARTAAATAAQRTLERRAREALLAAERAWYDDFACVTLTAAPANASAQVGQAVGVTFTASAPGTLALSDLARGRADGPSGLATTFTGTEAGRGGVTATLTGRRGRARARWEIDLLPPVAGPRRLVLVGVHLDGTISHAREELPQIPEDNVTTKWQTDGTMSYRTGDPFVGKPYDWDLLDTSKPQVATLPSVRYEASMKARIDQWVDNDHNWWVCDYVTPAPEKPAGLVGVLTRPGLDYEIFWSLMPAVPKCEGTYPLFGFEPLPSAALTSRFTASDLSGQGGAVVRLPVDIDHRWTDGAGTHRVTWKGYVEVVSA
ncbi:hypothetical protein DVA67_031060 [Solirubrobacter sp. CPCC 204708]|uniref:Uncharacterized protein n=1 Tax=Solirubrobacter deserti TaxID=2282478 RepID=A0ABT4RLD0_9ACTN|nr:hypothetical protein [Solirubrobacter deserti]MBE2320444.1 hypothetical protein [Solirubrobacter deserti]MDA0139365.1 hypothetical protein [Solirubrobacter deserti]